MKIKVDKYLGLRSILIIIFFTSLICAITLGFSAFLITNRNKPDNIIRCEGTILSVNYDEDEHHSLIVLNEYEYTFKITNNDLSNDLKKDDNVCLLYFNDTTSFAEVLVLKLYLGDNLLIDKTNSELESKNISLILMVIFTIVSIISLGMRSHFKKLVEVDYFEYYAKMGFNKLESYNKDKKTNKKRMIAVGIYMVVIVIVCTLIAVLGSNFPDYPHFIIPPAVLILVVNTYVLVKLYGYKWYNEKDVKLFVEKYLNELNQEIEQDVYEQFKSDGFYIYYVNYEEYSNEKIEVSKIIKYEDLNFYTYCYFTNDFHSVVIYICSDYLVYDEPFIMRLNQYNYYEIKQNNIKINGLDYLLNNLEEEIIKCHKDKIKFKKYGDK